MIKGEATLASGSHASVDHRANGTVETRIFPGILNFTVAESDCPHRGLSYVIRAVD